MHAVFKFLKEMVENRHQRLKFEMQNINGLIVFKEAAKCVMRMLEVWDCLECRQDTYVAKYKYVKEICQIFRAII